MHLNYLNPWAVLVGLLRLSKCLTQKGKWRWKTFQTGTRECGSVCLDECSLRVGFKCFAGRLCFHYPQKRIVHMWIMSVHYQKKRWKRSGTRVFEHTHTHARCVWCERWRQRLVPSPAPTSFNYIHSLVCVAVKSLTVVWTDSKRTRQRIRCWLWRSSSVFGSRFSHSGQMNGSIYAS